MDEIFDVLIIGSGPAGVSAALTARQRGKSALIISTSMEDSPLYRAELVDNYPGFPAATGAQLVEAFTRHAEASGVKFARGRALAAADMGGVFGVSVGSDFVQGRSLVIAGGLTRAKPYPGEAEYLGRGVSYCATCDGMLYRGRPVVVAGRSKEAPREAAYLKELGCQVVYVAPRRPEQLDPAIPFVQANRLEVEGEQTVTGLRADGALLPCSGIFILREAVAPTDLLPGLETENGAIRVDRRMATSIPGVFAAGDCTGEPLQVSKAVGEGLTAALSAAEYLDQLPKKDTAE